jgi:hypothetical protein
MRHHIEVPTLEPRERFFRVESMEFLARAWFDGKGANLNKVIHSEPHTK